MIPPDREASNPADRRHYLIGTAALLFIAVVLARYQVFTIDRKYGPEQGGGNANGIRLDLNAADASELAVLSDVGPERARKIVEFRSEHGPFRSITELLRVDGIGPETLAKMLPYIAVSEDARR